jgi:hypothetical protein
MKSAPLDIVMPPPASIAADRQSHIDMMDVVWKTAATTTKLASLSSEGAALIVPSRSISARCCPDESLAWRAVVADVAGTVSTLHLFKRLFSTIFQHNEVSCHWRASPEKHVW